jgi:hypothetical protein
VSANVERRAGCLPFWGNTLNISYLPWPMYFGLAVIIIAFAVLVNVKTNDSTTSTPTIALVDIITIVFII